MVVLRCIYATLILANGFLSDKTSPQVKWSNAEKLLNELT